MNTTEHKIHVVHTLMLCQYEIAAEVRALGLWHLSLNIQRRYCYWMYSKIAAKTVDTDQGVHTSSEPSHTPTQRAMHITQTSMQAVMQNYWTPYNYSTHQHVGDSTRGRNGILKASSRDGRERAHDRLALAERALETRVNAAL